MPEQIDSISIKVTLDDRLVLKQLNKIKSIASNIPVKLNTNSFNNQINRMQNRLNNLVLNPKIGQGIGANIAKQISNEVKNAFSGNVLGNIIGETLSAKVTGDIISDNLEKTFGSVGKRFKKRDVLDKDTIDSRREFASKYSPNLIKQSKLKEFPELANLEELHKKYFGNSKFGTLTEQIKESKNYLKKLRIDLRILGSELDKLKVEGKAYKKKIGVISNISLIYGMERDRFLNLYKKSKTPSKLNKPVLSHLPPDLSHKIIAQQEAQLDRYVKSLGKGRLKQPKQPKTSWQKLTGFLGSGMGLAGGSLGAFYGATKTIKVMQQLTIESAKSQQITAKLNGVLAATGNTTGFTSKQLNKLAEQLSLTTNFTDEQITSAQTLLATYSNISGKIFKKTLDAATDLAEVIGTDIVSSAKVLGRILNDPLASLSSIRKLGVSLSKEQKSQIENLINQNKLYEAQLIILDEINSKVGGGGANNVNKLTQIGKAWDEVKESVGDILIDIGQYTGFFDNTLNALRGLNEGLNNTQDIAKGTVGIFRLWNNPLSGISNIISGSMTEESKNKITSFFENVGKKIENVGKKINSGIKYLKIDKGVKKLLGIDDKPIEPLFKTPKVLLNDKAQDKLTTTLDKAKNKSKELKDNLMDAFNISDISNWWDIFVQSTVDLQNKITNGLIEQQMMNNNRFNSPTDSPIIEAIEDGNRDNFDLMEEQNELLSQIARNGGIFA